jgi:hypothetical protein
MFSDRVGRLWWLVADPVNTACTAGASVCRKLPVGVYSAISIDANTTCLLTRDALSPCGTV